MAGSQFTLAALATTAVPGLLVTGTKTLGSESAGDYESAVLLDSDHRQIVIRRPRGQRAEARQSADLVAIRALSAGIRARLPFDVAQYLGQVPVGSTRAIVTTFVPGSRLLPRMVADDPGLAASVGASVSAIHQLPTSFVSDAGLPTLTPFELLRSAVSVMDRAVATGLVPAALVNRWEAAAKDQQLWQFTPTVVHGSLDAEALLISGSTVSGVLGWGELRVGDPAKDLAWVLGTGNTTAVDTVFSSYETNGGARDRQLRQRARLYHELGTAQWLLHGVQVKSTEVVDDAVGMMSRLVDAVHATNAPIRAASPETMEIGEVEQFLSSTERRHG